MSLEATKWAWSTKAQHGARLVLLALAECHNGKTQLCCPSVVHLMEMTQLCREAVVTGIQDIEAAGLVMVERKDGCGSRYVLAIETEATTPTGLENRPVYNLDRTSLENRPHRSKKPTRNRKEPETKRNSCAKAPGGELELIAETPGSKPARKPNVAFDAIAECCGLTASLTQSEAGRIAKALAEIKATCPEMSADELAVEIRKRAVHYRVNLPPGSLLTPTALSGNWSLCATTRATSRTPQSNRNGIESLKDQIAAHPANRESVKFIPARVTDEQKTELANLRAELARLQTPQP